MPVHPFAVAGFGGDAAAAQAAQERYNPSQIDGVQINYGDSNNYNLPGVLGQVPGRCRAENGSGRVWVGVLDRVC